MILTDPFIKNPKGIFFFYPTVVAVVGSHDIDLPGLLTWTNEFKSSEHLT